MEYITFIIKSIEEDNVDQDTLLAYLDIKDIYIELKKVFRSNPYYAFDNFHLLPFITKRTS